MRLAIFAKTFSRPTLDRVCEAIRSHGLCEAHFNLACAGLDSLPRELPSETCRLIAQALTRHGLRLCGVSATFNSIHPDAPLRGEMTRRACGLIERCPDLGADLVTLCTGTRCERDMWTDHPANRDQAAWSDLCRTIEALLKAATRYGVVLGIEPERANVIDSAEKARRLLDFFQTPQLKIVIDAANLPHPNEEGNAPAILDNALDLLGPDIVMAHAKEMPRQPGGAQTLGTGLVDWNHYLRGLRRIGFTGPLVLHGMDEAEVADGVRFLEDRVEEAYVSL